jgi:hypothetical protein
MTTIHAYYVDKQRMIIAISYLMVFALGIYIARLISSDDSVTPHGTNQVYQTDKVKIRHFNTMYGKYLHQYVGSAVSLLEIGLGCGMSSKPGASAYLWRNYLGLQANIHFIENDTKCAKKWYKTHKHKVKSCKKICKLVSELEINFQKQAIQGCTAMYYIF